MMMAEIHLKLPICDLINELVNGPKAAVEAIKKRFQVNAGKNNAVVMYTLIVSVFMAKYYDKVK